jgi:hypothetical protein
MLITISKLRLAFYTACVIGAVFVGIMFYRFLGPSFPSAFVVYLAPSMILSAVFVWSLPNKTTDLDKMGYSAQTFAFVVGLIAEGIVFYGIYGGAGLVIPAVIFTYFWTSYLSKGYVGQL